MFINYITLQTGNIDCIDEDIIVVSNTTSTPTPIASKNSVVSHKQFVEMNDDQKPSTPVNCVKSEGKRKYGNSPLPDPLPFPNNFSVAVQQAIDNETVLSVRQHLVNDIGSFYFGLTSHPQQGDYKRIALLICKKFPELRDSTPSNYWVSFPHVQDCIHPVWIITISISTRTLAHNGQPAFQYYFTLIGCADHFPPDQQKTTGSWLLLETLIVLSRIVP